MPRIPYVDPENEPAELRPGIRPTPPNPRPRPRHVSPPRAPTRGARGAPAYFHAALDEGVLPRAFKEKSRLRPRGSAVPPILPHRTGAMRSSMVSARANSMPSINTDFSALEPREQAALAFAQSMVKSNGMVPDDLCDQLRTHVSDAEFVEIVALIGIMQLASTFGAVFDLQPD